MMKKYNQSQSQESKHFFISKALTANNIDLSGYKDEAFKHELRLVAIDAILSILKQIHSKKEYAKNKREVFDASLVINTVHPITCLNMLDYCLAAGFDDMAIQLIHHGATSKNLKSFQRNVNTTFSNDEDQPEIVRDIQEIIHGCMQIKQNYDDFVSRTHEVTPRIFTAGQRIFTGYSVSALVMFGIGGILLSPLCVPLAHAIGLPTLLVSLGAVPAVASGVYASGRSINNNQSQRQQQQITNHNHEDDMIMLKSLKETAEIIKAALQKKPNVNLRVHSTKSYYQRQQHRTSDLSESSVTPEPPLLLNFSNAKNRKKMEQLFSGPKHKLGASI